MNIRRYIATILNIRASTTRLLVMGLVCAGAAGAQAADDEAIWKRLDITEDGWLDGKELEGGWQKYDADGDNEVTKAEFLAGRAKEQAAATGSPQEDARLFKQLDISGNGLLTGKELEAGNVRTYDANQDGRVTSEEFLAARARLRQSAGEDKVATASTSPAPKSSYKPGDKILYKSSDDPQVWEEGVFVEMGPDGDQPIIRLKPTEFFPEGFQQADQWSNIRPFNATLTATPVKAALATTVKTESTAPKPAIKGGLMTQDEILSYLTRRLGMGKSSSEQREEVATELCEIIKQRGVDFRYEPLSDFASKLGRMGYLYDVSTYVWDNYGPPTKQNWLMGAWRLSKIGGVVDSVKDGRIVRQNESAAGNYGSLTINANSTYVWKYFETAVRGAWRKATDKEMQSQGGAGVVLLKAQEGYDWIVMENRKRDSEGNWIGIHQLEYRQMKETGFRPAATKK